jgi:transcriptional regulator with XRE-family HTH domain
MRDARVATVLRFIAANVRRLRLRRRWTQERLAESAKLEPRYVQTIESGLANPSAAVLVAMADALGVTPGILFRQSALLPQPPGRPRKVRRRGVRHKQ